mgnify:CR=1 FL=1|jgi:hypothetical protein
MKPVFPIRVALGDGAEWDFKNEEELGVSLEWCNTDTEADVRAFDASGRSIRVIVEDYEVLTLEVEGAAGDSAGPDSG